LFAAWRPLIRFVFHAQMLRRVLHLHPYERISFTLYSLLVYGVDTFVHLKHDAALLVTINPRHFKNSGVKESQSKALSYQVRQKTNPLVLFAR